MTTPVEKSISQEPWYVWRTLGKDASSIAELSSLQRSLAAVASYARRNKVLKIVCPALGFGDTMVNFPCSLRANNSVISESKLLPAMPAKAFILVVDVVQFFIGVGQMVRPVLGRTSEGACPIEGGSVIARYVDSEGRLQCHRHVPRYAVRITEEPSGRRNDIRIYPIMKGVILVC
jgi:hypothetical protein